MIDDKVPSFFRQGDALGGVGDHAAEAPPVLLPGLEHALNGALEVGVIELAGDAHARGKIGVADATAALESILTDKSSVINFGGGGNETYQLGDAALAALVSIHKKERKDYGFGSEMNIGFGFGGGSG